MVLKTQLVPATGDPRPAGRLRGRKKIGHFVFVQHDYPEPAQSARHSHPWLRRTNGGS